jgi:hypothetical protein
MRPFRSPLMRIEGVLAGKDGVYASGRVQPPTNSVKFKTYNGAKHLETDFGMKGEKDESAAWGKEATQDRTANAGKPFKALMLNTSSGGTSRGTSVFSMTSSSSVHGTAMLQALQARVQKLKQAVKIRDDRARAGGKSDLAALVTKWRTVGREVAWLVWDTVKDLEPGEGLKAGNFGGGWNASAVSSTSGKRSSSRSDAFQPGWGYDDGKTDGQNGFGNSWGWDEKTVDEDEKFREDGPMEASEKEQELAAQNHSLGTMLRYLGIDPETLGWDEDEGDFVGEP